METHLELNPRVGKCDPSDSPVPGLAKDGSCLAARFLVPWCQRPTLSFLPQTVSGYHRGRAAVTLCQNEITAGKHPAGPGAVPTDGRLPPGQSLLASSTLSRPACLICGGSKRPIMLLPHVSTSILAPHCPFLSEDAQR